MQVPVDVDVRILIVVVVRAAEVTVAVDRTIGVVGYHYRVLVLQGEKTVLANPHPPDTAVKWVKIEKGTRGRQHDAT